MCTGSESVSSYPIQTIFVYLDNHHCIYGLQQHPVLPGSITCVLLHWHRVLALIPILADFFVSTLNCMCIISASVQRLKAVPA